MPAGPILAEHMSRVNRAHPGILDAPPQCRTTVELSLTDSPASVTITTRSTAQARCPVADSTHHYSLDILARRIRQGRWGWFCVSPWGKAPVVRILAVAEQEEGKGSSARQGKEPIDV